MTTLESVLDGVREARQTELSRLGSSRGLYADTAGDIDTEPVLRAAARAEYAAWQTFDAWATAESDEDLSEFFATVADDERGHYETVLDHLPDEVEPTDVPSLHSYLRTLETTPERIGGFAGRVVASRRSKDQVVGYFVGQADPQTAATFRTFGADLDEQRAALATHFERVCTEDEDFERVRVAAVRAIDAAYEEYVVSLEALGVNPKPVC